MLDDDSDWWSFFQAGIFLVIVTAAGIFSYIFSIKLRRPTFTEECAENKNKKNKKKKMVKIKINEEDDDVKSFKERNVEDKMDEMRIPVQKSGKVSKIEKSAVTKIPTISKVEPKNEIEIIDDKCKSKKSQKHISKVTVQQDNKFLQNEEMITEKIKKIDTFQNVEMLTANKEKNMDDDKNTSKQQTVQKHKFKKDVISSITNKVDNVDIQLSESPTNSLTDDFVLVDGSKTSSDEAVTIDGCTDNVVIVDKLTSFTSGASRKKNKKHQKIISKQLLEAAIVEDDTSHNEELAAFTIAKKPFTLKNRRPRKDN